MTNSNLLNIIGLVFDLIGVIMLFKYGLPENIDKSGAVYFVTGSKDKDEIEKAKKYEFLEKLERKNHPQVNLVHSNPNRRHTGQQRP